MEKSRHRLEIPIFGPESGPKAAAAGAAQIELNRAGSYGQFFLPYWFLFFFFFLVLNYPQP